MSEPNEEQHYYPELQLIEPEQKSTHEQFMELMTKLNAKVDDLIAKKKRKAG